MSAFEKWSAEYRRTHAVDDEELQALREAWEASNTIAVLEVSAAHVLATGRDASYTQGWNEAVGWLVNRLRRGG